MARISYDFVFFGNLFNKVITNFRTLCLFSLFLGEKSAGIWDMDMGYGIHISVKKRSQCSEREIPTYEIPKYRNNYTNISYCNNYCS